MSRLLESYAINSSLCLKNRVVMAPMTRAFAANSGAPTSEMVEYYSRRANAGLIVTEGTIIHPAATGYHNVPGIYSKEHINAWRRVTEAVHDEGGRIFLQLWHVGRVSHPSFLGGNRPLAPSETTMSGPIRRSKNMFYGTSRAASLVEIQAIIQQFADAAEHAMASGMDGVEIHGANGYLIDQFLHHSTNLRDDVYGGNPRNMTRFLLSILDACKSRMPEDRIGIRLSPAGYLNEVEPDPRDEAVFSELFKSLNSYRLAYVHTGNFNDAVKFPVLGGKTMTQFIRAHYRGTVIASGGYDLNSASEVISSELADLVSIGRPFIANPDLMVRYRQGLPICPYDPEMLSRLY